MRRGAETWGGDPKAVIEQLVAPGVDAHVNTVGFTVDDGQLKTQFREWARADNGQAFDASGSADLRGAGTQAL